MGRPVFFSSLRARPCLRYSLIGLQRFQPSTKRGISGPVCVCARVMESVWIGNDVRRAIGRSGRVSQAQNSRTEAEPGHEPYRPRAAGAMRYRPRARATSGVLPLSYPIPLDFPDSDRIACEYGIGHLTQTQLPIIRPVDADHWRRTETGPSRNSPSADWYGVLGARPLQARIAHQDVGPQGDQRHCHVEVLYFEYAKNLETRGQRFQRLSSLARRAKWPLLRQCDNALRCVTLR
jgi:hypothetical protein